MKISTGKSAETFLLWKNEWVIRCGIKRSFKTITQEMKRIANRTQYLCSTTQAVSILHPVRDKINQLTAFNQITDTGGNFLLAGLSVDSMDILIKCCGKTRQGFDAERGSHFRMGVHILGVIHSQQRPLPP